MTACAPEIPKNLVNQLDDNGIMIIPIGEDNNIQVLKKIVKKRKKNFEPGLNGGKVCSFVRRESAILMRFLFFIFFLTSCESFFFQDFKIKHFPKTSKNEELYYKVKKGDNLYFIAKKFNVTIPKLINYNNINAPYKIYPNQKIFIPKKKEFI